MDNLNDIISSLSNDDIDMLKGVANQILGESAAEKPALPSPPSSSGVPLNIGSDDLQLIMRAKSIMDKMNGAKSKNAELIAALKPHLSPHAQQRADQAIRILRLLEILPYMKDLF